MNQYAIVAGIMCFASGAFALFGDSVGMLFSACISLLVGAWMISENLREHQMKLNIGKERD